MRLFLIAIVIVACGCAQRTPTKTMAPKSGAVSAVTTTQNVEDVVGTYKLGSNLGISCTLELQDDSTFVFSYYGALGRHGSIEGTFERHEEQVVLDPESPIDLGGNVTQSTVLYPVKWADRLYLIGEHQILRFCDRVRQGWVGELYGGSGGYYYLQIRGEPTEEELLSREESTPEVPEAYRKYLTEEFTCQVLEHISESRVMIDKGATDGVVVKSKLNSPDGRSLIVSTVKENESDCRIWQTNAELPKVGVEYRPAD